jgi:hypothetical protein
MSLSYSCREIWKSWLVTTQLSSLNFIINKCRLNPWLYDIFTFQESAHEEMNFKVVHCAPTTLLTTPTSTPEHPPFRSYCISLVIKKPPPPWKPPTRCFSTPTTKIAASNPPLTPSPPKWCLHNPSLHPHLAHHYHRPPPKTQPQSPVTLSKTYN